MLSWSCPIKKTNLSTLIGNTIPPHFLSFIHFINLQHPPFSYRGAANLIEFKIDIRTAYLLILISINHISGYTPCSNLHLVLFFAKIHCTCSFSRVVALNSENGQGANSNVSRKKVSKASFSGSSGI